MIHSSHLIEEALAQLSRLPGIGEKTALRLVLYTLRQDKIYAHSLARALTTLVDQIRYCTHCHGLSDTNVCSICSDTTRTQDLICVVEDVQNIMAIEATAQYRGLYHVLGGLVAPLRGQTPDKLRITSLLKRVEAQRPKEVILALSATIEGDTTALYISKKVAAFDVRVSSIARGIPVGGELEYTDEVTLGRSILRRTPMNAHAT